MGVHQLDDLIACPVASEYESQCRPEVAHGYVETPSETDDVKRLADSLRATRTQDGISQDLAVCPRIAVTLDAATLAWRPKPRIGELREQPRDYRVFIIAG